MILALILSSIAAGLIATCIMVAFLYLPLLWGGDYFDVIGALGSAITGELNARARFLGAMLYFAAGILFAMLYGWLALSIMQTVDVSNLPPLHIPGLPVQINFLYPLLGLAIGLGHGVLVALLVTVIAIEHHPLKQFHTRYILVISQLISHLVFGFVVMFFHSQFLQLLLR
jgi:hypothetical protein